MADRSEREVLHHLIDICKDGELGYRAAAHHVSDPDLRMLFAELAAQRRGFAEQLTPHLQRMGGTANGGTNAGVVHRGWMAVRGWHDHAIVAEAERGEQAALDAYYEALHGMLPPTVTDLVESQRDAIEKATHRIHVKDMSGAR